MLSESAAQIAYALRHHVGNDKSGVGPETRVLLTLTDLAPEDLLNALEELEDLGFVTVLRGQPAEPRSVPREFRKIVAVLRHGAAASLF